MRTDYTAVKRHMKGNGRNGSTDSLHPPPPVTINGFENSATDEAVCPMRDLRGVEGRT